MTCRRGLCLLLVAALAACVAEAGVRDLRNKYRTLVGQEGGLISSAGGSAAASASASSAGVSSAVAASAAAAGYGHQAGGRVPHGGMPQGAFVGHQEPRHHHHHHQPQPQYYAQPQQAPVYGRPPVVGAYRQPQPPPQYRQPAAYYGAEGGLIEEPAYYGQQAAAYGNQQMYGGAHQAGYAHQQPMQYQYAQQAPRHHNQVQHGYAPEPAHFVKSPRMQHQQAAYPNQGAATSSAAAASAASVGGGAAAAASSVSGGASHNVGHAGAAAMGAAASTATGYYQEPRDRRTVDEEEMSEHYYEPETVQHYEAQAGTFGNGAGGVYEQGSYVRDTESVENHEDGREDGDHYYQAQAYGKTSDVNNHVAYNNDDEDIVHTPNMFRKKKSNTNFVSNFNKQHRETGSGVTAHDKHSASYNKNSKKLKENVDQRFSKNADGMVQTKAFDSHTDVDDEDEEAMDTRGLGNFVGVDGVLHGRRAQPNNPAAAAAAAATASFQTAH